MNETPEPAQPAEGALPAADCYAADSVTQDAALLCESAAKRIVADLELDESIAGKIAYAWRCGYSEGRRHNVRMSDHATMTPELPTETQSRGSLHAVVMPLSQRVANYHRVTGFPESLFVGGDGRIVGTWIMGNDYRVKSEYYGGYPAGYLRRIKALFPDKQRVLHLFSGRVDTSVMPGETVDVNPKLSPDYVDDAQTLERVPLESYDLVMADPPYSVEDCERYQTTMVKRNKVMASLGARLTPGCHVVWLDQVLPMFKKSFFKLQGVIGMVKSTNHRFRVVVIFEKI